MKELKNTKKKWALFSIFTTVVLITACQTSIIVKALNGFAFTVSPMSENIVLNPGDEYSSSLDIYIPTEYENNIKYNVEIVPYFVDENYNNDFNNEYGTSSRITEWISFDTPKEGKLSPGQKTTILYTINVPEDAAGGGQYAAILVSANIWDNEDSRDSENTKNDKIDTAIKEEKKIAYIIYAEIAGDITRQGEIVDVNMPSFLLSEDIAGSSSIKNTGNVHGEAEYILQVFPLFSDEEIYTNEDDPATATILPNRTRYQETSWNQTPAIGIFNVIYTVEFEGVTTQVSKIVIKCPVWLLFIIIFAIMALIIWLITRTKSRGKKKSRKVSNSATSATEE